jgi:hypothetical protein
VAIVVAASGCEMTRFPGVSVMVAVRAVADHRLNATDDSVGRARMAFRSMVGTVVWKASVGDDVTVMVADPETPLVVAVMVALPAATAVTTPVVDTVATPAAADDHAMLRPVSVAPF